MTQEPVHPSRAVQLTGSLLVAVLIVAVVIVLVVGRLGADPDFAEERAEERAEQAEDVRDD